MTGPAGQPSGDGDLDTRVKVQDVVVAFYCEVVFDDLLAPVCAVPPDPLHLPWSPPRERAVGAPDDAVGARWSPHRP